MSGDITEPFVAIQDPRSRSSSPSSSDWERPIQVSPFGQLRDGVEAILKSDYGAAFTDLHSFPQMCQYKSGQCGSAILIETSAAHLWNGSSLNGTGIHLRRLGYDTCALTDPSRSKFLQSVVSFSRDAISRRISTPLMIAFSGVGDEEFLKFRDGRLCITQLFSILQCIPVTIPIALLFDCIGSHGDRKRLEAPFQNSQREYILYHVKRSVRSPTSLFYHLQAQLPDSSSLKSIIESYDEHFLDKSTTFVWTNLFDHINLRAFQCSLPGVPLCDCGKCDIYKVFNLECERPSNFTIPGVASRDRFTLTPSHPISIDQQHILKHRFGSLLCLLEEYFSCLRMADPDEVILQASAFFDGELKARFRPPTDPVAQLHQYIQEENLWINDEDLQRLKELAEAIDSCVGMQIVEKMQSLFSDIISERTIRTCEVMTYPSYCHLPHKPQFVFILDDEFRKLPFSESVFYALYYRVRMTLNSDGYITFVTLKTALEKGLNIMAPS